MILVMLVLTRMMLMLMVMAEVTANFAETVPIKNLWDYIPESKNKASRIILILWIIACSVHPRSDCSMLLRFWSCHFKIN